MKHFMAILVLAAMLYPAPILGQPTLAVRGGVNIATFSGDIAKWFMTGRRNIKLGVSAAFPVKGRFGFQLNSDYVQKGAYAGLDDIPVEIDYIEFSGLANITLVSPRRAPSIFLLIGPSAALRIRSAGEDQLAKIVGADNFEFNALDFGIVAGAGTQMTFSEAMTIKAELLYAEGIRGISKIHVHSIKNRTIAVQIGLGIPPQW